MNDPIIKKQQANNLGCWKPVNIIPVKGKGNGNNIPIKGNGNTPPEAIADTLLLIM